MPVFKHNFYDSYWLNWSDGTWHMIDDCCEEKIAAADPDLEDDVKTISESMKAMIEKRREQGFLTYGDLFEALDTNIDLDNSEINPFALYIGYWDKFEEDLKKRMYEDYRKQWALETILKLTPYDETYNITRDINAVKTRLNLYNKALDEKEDFE